MNSSTKDIYVKHTLGRVWILLLFVWLQAEDFTYQIEASKHKVYLHEPFQVTVDIQQTNPDVVLLFQFEINKSPNYTFKPLYMKNENMLHHINLHMVYEIFPLTKGDIDITFSLIKRVTTDDKVRYFASGDRDDFKKLETIDYPIHIPKIGLHVKSLPKGTQLVGDFTLNYTFKQHQAKAYESLPLQVKITGTGYPPLLDTLIPKSDNYTLFTEKPLVHSSVVSEVTQSTITYPIALSAKQNFILDAIEIQAFNPKNQKAYTLTIPKQVFKIEPINTDSLVDRVDSPPLLKSDFTWIKNLLSYLIVFMAGFLTAYTLKWHKRSNVKIDNPLIDKIKNTKNTKALLQLLMATDAQRFAPAIEKLENAYTKDAKINLSKVKEEAIDLI